MVTRKTNSKKRVSKDSIKLGLNKSELNASVSSSQRAPKISKHELEQALNFLKSDVTGKRLQAAEYALTLLIKDELPRLRQYVFNSSFNLRQINDLESFEEVIQRTSTPADLFKESRAAGHIKVNFEKDQLRIVLFYESNLSKNEALMFSHSFGEVIALTYAALGLDVSGYTQFIGDESFD